MPNRVRIRAPPRALSDDADTAWRAVACDAAGFTDSFAPVLDRVPFDASGCPEGSFEVVPLGGDFVSQPGFNAYGIAATPDGSTLFVVHSALGTIYAVDPVSGVADEIDLGGDAVPSGDGLLLDGPILHVVQNAVNARFGTPPTASTSYDVVRVDKVSVAR